MVVKLQGVKWLCVSSVFRLATALCENLFFLIVTRRDVSVTGRGSREPTPEVEDQQLTSEWWASFVNKDMQFDMHLGGKIVLLSRILKMAESIGDKV